MTYGAIRAVIVLEDCRFALEELKAEPRGPAWRVRWVGMLALLRAVGHVLRKVDASPAAAPEFREAVAEWWRDLNRSKPEPSIFWHFIEASRNAVLKEYDLGAGQGVTSHVGGPVNYHYPIYGGPYDGRDQREVVQEAIDWWDAQLNRLAVTAGAKALVTQRG